MATKEKATTFPSIAANNWWAIRAKFKQSLPSKLSPSTIAAWFGMKEESAKANVLPALISCGLVDENGATTERAARWREDSHYAAVCKEIMEEVYPDDLQKAFPPPSPDREPLERWFALNLKYGAKASEKAAALYTLLCKADPTEAAKEQKAQAPKSKADAGAARPKKDASGVKVPAHKGARSGAHAGFQPSININLQIHVSPQATPEQIDAIFESMAKHISLLRDEVDE